MSQILLVCLFPFLSFQLRLYNPIQVAFHNLRYHVRGTWEQPAYQTIIPVCSVPGRPNLGFNRATRSRRGNRAEPIQDRFSVFFALYENGPQIRTR